MDKAEYKFVGLLVVFVLVAFGAGCASYFNPNIRKKLNGDTTQTVPSSLLTW